MGTGWRAPASGRPRASDAQINVSGGLNTTADDTQMGENDVRRLDNARLTEFGGAIKRGGSQILHTSAFSANPVRGGFSWRPAAGQTLLAVCNGRLYTATYGALPIAWTDRGAAVDPNVYPSFAEFRNGATDTCYIADGGLLNKWNGALTTNIAGTPSVSRIAVYNQRLFGVLGTDETLWFSALNDGDTLGNIGSGGGSAIVRTFGDQAITTIATLKSSLLLFHVSGISRFTGISQDDISIAAGSQGVTSDVGTIAPQSVVPTENEVFFLTDRGFYSATESGVTPISQKIDDTIRTLFDPANSSRVCAVHARRYREVWWYLPDLGFYCFNYYLRAWSGPFDSGYANPATYSAWEAVDTTNTPLVLVGDINGYVKQADYPNTWLDNVAAAGTGGTAYQMVVKHKRFYMGDLSSVKALRFLYVLGNLQGSNSTNISWVIGSTYGTYTVPAAPSFAWDAFGTAWDSGVWDTAGDSEYRIPAGGTGPWLDVTLADNGSTPVSLSGVTVQAYDMGRRW